MHFRTFTSRVVVALLLGACVWSMGAKGGLAQAELLRSGEGAYRVMLAPVYQQYTDDGRTLTQASSRLSVSMPLLDQMRLRASAQYALMDAEGAPRIRGLDDVHASVTYARTIGESSLVFGLDANLPAGKRGLTSDQLRTTAVASRNYYHFRVSSFGQGLTVAPRVTWAVPLTERIVVGVGATYQHERGFRPRQNMTDTYVPGDGVGVNGGVDVQLTRTSTLGVDATFRRYGPDQQGGATQFEAGNRLAGTVRYLYRKGFTQVQVRGHYANWAPSQYYDTRAADPSGVRVNVIPSHGMAEIGVRMRIVDDIRVETQLAGHRYSATSVSPEQLLGTVRLTPSFDIQDTVVIAPHGQLTLGSFRGMGGGLRIQAEL